MGGCSGSGGGFPQVSDENPGGQVLVYIDSDDIEADLKKVEKLGGKVHPPESGDSRVPVGLASSRTQQGMCWRFIPA